MKDKSRFKIAIILIVLGMILTCGCTSAVKKMLMAPSPTVTPDIKPVSNVEIVNITEENKIEEPFDLMLYRTQGRYLNESFSWYRDNVSGYKDLEVHTIVYDYKIMHNYLWWSDNWGQYFYQIPDEGKKFLFLFVITWMEGSDPSKDPRMWGPDWNHYSIQYEGKIINRDEGYIPPIRIKEFDEVWDYQHVESLEPYGFYHYQNLQSGKITAIPNQWLRMGKSNAWDGFIQFQIPIDANPDDIIVLGDMYSFGRPYWLLKERPQPGIAAGSL